MDKKYTAAIILAAGLGSRMGGNVKKQMLPILGKSVIFRTLCAFNECDAVDEIVLAVHEDEAEYIKSEIAPGFSKIKSVICGGKTRAESAKLAFEAVSDKAEYIAVHDGARCLITSAMISKVVSQAYDSGAATAGSYVTDTVKQLSADGLVKKTIPRDTLFLASTPQAFKTELYKKALQNASDTDKITDDNMLIEMLGIPISAVDLGRENIKITTPKDIEYAEYIITKRERTKMAKIRVGHGYDVHRFAKERKLIIGGVEIPHTEGLLGHSDADVLLHAVMDALLGAAALGDIGRHFPDTDEKYRGASSLMLLSEVGKLVSEKGYIVSNIDATLVLQSPKVAKYVDEMTENIANTLGVSKDRVNVKATTEEKLGFTGSGEGAAAHSVALIEKK